MKYFQCIIVFLSSIFISCAEMPPEKVYFPLESGRLFNGQINKDKIFSILLPNTNEVKWFIYVPSVIPRKDHFLLQAHGSAEEATISGSILTSNQKDINNILTSQLTSIKQVKYTPIDIKNYNCVQGTGEFLHTYSFNSSGYLVKIQNKIKKTSTVCFWGVQNNQQIYIVLNIDITFPTDQQNANIEQLALQDYSNMLHSLNLEK